MPKLPQTTETVELNLGDVLTEARHDADRTVELGLGDISVVEGTTGVARSSGTNASISGSISSSTTLHRSVARSRQRDGRMTVAIAAGSAASLLTCAAVLAIASLHATPTPAPLPAKPVATTIALPVPHAIAMPSPQVDYVAAEAPAHPAIDVACIFGEESCTSDNGFPAISADGTLIARAHIPDDGGRGFPGLTIQLVDTKTTKIIRELRVLDPDEYETIDRGVVATRASAAQRELDARHFRTLAPLVDNFDGVHATFEGDKMTLSVGDQPLWTHRFVSKLPSTTPPMTEESMCGGAELVESSGYWDPATRLVLVEQRFTTGGCLCGVLDDLFIARVPTP